MSETWREQGSTRRLTGDAAQELVQARLSTGRLTTWFESSAGRVLATVSNGDRAMVMLLRDTEGDPGEHAVDPTADGHSGGFVLENGEVDEYADADTVPLSAALEVLRHLVDEGVPPPGMPWSVER